MNCVKNLIVYGGNCTNYKVDSANLTTNCSAGDSTPQFIGDNYHQFKCSQCSCTNLKICVLESISIVGTTSISSDEQFFHNNEEPWLDNKVTNQITSSLSYCKLESIAEEEEVECLEPMIQKEFLDSSSSEDEIVYIQDLQNTTLESYVPNVTTTNSPNPPTININQTFTFPKQIHESINHRECSTQTSQLELVPEDHEDFQSNRRRPRKIWSNKKFIKSKERIMSSYPLKLSKSKMTKKLKKFPRKRNNSCNSWDCVGQIKRSESADSQLSDVVLSKQLADGSEGDHSIYSNANVSLEEVMDKLSKFTREHTVQGLHELLDLAPMLNWQQYERELALINRKLIELMRTPRTHVCRIVCQVCGELFRIIKSKKRPEFDDLVEILLNKSADTNRFIQRDANVALDKMIANIAASHAVRAICMNGPIHKNHLVRANAARLLTGICSINGLDATIGGNANQLTRKRVLAALVKFLMDKNLETRKNGERFYKLLRKHRFFQEYLFKDLEINVKLQLKKILNVINK